MSDTPLHGKNRDVDFSALRRIDVSTPDLTRSIMGRLGYMKVSPVVARRRRIRQWGTRAGMALSAMIAIATGLQIYENGPTIRKPTGPTVPSAIGNDLHRQQNRIGGMIQTIRNLAPQAPSQLQLPIEEQQIEPAPGEPVGDDVNSPSSSSPLRWV